MQPASIGCSSRVWVFPTSNLQSKIRVCGAQCSNESPSGAFKRQNGLRQQMEGPCPNKFADVYTSALLATTMKPLNALPQIWKSFCNWDRPFSSSTWSGRLFFCSGNFCICNRSKQGKLVPTRNFLNQIFQIRLQKYLLGFAQTRYSAQNCADCASYPLKALWPTRGWYHPVLSLFAKVFIAFSCNPPKVAYFQIFLLTQLDFCGSLFQQFNITYLLRVPARLPKESEQVFDFLIAT